MKVITKPFEALTAREVFDIMRLRQEVFVLEQACLYPDMDDTDLKAWHVFMWTDGQVVAYARVFDKENGMAQIGRVLVRPKYRRMHRASCIVDTAMKVARTELQARQIYLESQTYAIGLYASLGFEVVSDEFLEDGIPHVKMLFSFE